MSLGNVLWIVGTALAASSDDPLVAAATDGESVWITRDAGLRWQRIVSPETDSEDEEVALLPLDSGGDDDLAFPPPDGDGDPAAEADDTRPPVRSIALLG